MTEYPNTWIFRELVKEGLDSGHVADMIDHHLFALEQLPETIEDRDVAIKECVDLLREMGYEHR